MKCSYQSDTLTCRRCGHIAKRLPTFRTCPAVPIRPNVRLPRVALGDALERMLSSIGITKELVQRITRKPCNCPARQKWLNQWGYEKQAQVERIVKKAARWYGIT
jgi:hypothetical protein